MTLAPSEFSRFEEATTLYNSQNYTECDEILNQLMEAKPDHPKLLVNKALLDFARSTEPKKVVIYLSELRRIASVERIELHHDASNDRSFNNSGSGSIDLDSLKENLPLSSVSTSLRYNYALILFYQRHYLRAEQLLAACLGVPSLVSGIIGENSTLYDRSFHVEPFQTPSLDFGSLIDLNLARRIILLWLETLLQLRLSAQVYELCASWLSLLSSLVIANRLNSSNSSSDETSDSSPTLSQSNAQTADLLRGICKPVQLFYIRACLLTGRFQEAERELNELEQSTRPVGVGENIFGCDGSWNFEQSLSFLRAHLAYLKGDNSSALRQLADIEVANPLDSRYCLRHLVLNNCALIHHRSGQYNLGFTQFRRASAELTKFIRHVSTQSGLIHSDATDGSAEHTKMKCLTLAKVPLYLFPWAECHETLYNSALSLLFGQKPTSAFQLLLRLVRIYPRNPRLWLRLAECCIRIHKPKHFAAWQLEERSRCVLQAVGTGPCRTLMFAVQEEDNSNALTTSEDLESTTPKPTLEFAYLCLRNALLLLPRVPLKLEIDDKNRSSRSAAIYKWANEQSVPTLPSATTLRGSSLLHLLSYIHLNIAYVALCLNNPIATLHAARSLIPFEELPPEVSLDGTSRSNSIHLALICPSFNKFLARLYLSEALTDFDRLKDSIALLQFCTRDPPIDDELMLSISSFISSSSNPAHSEVLIQPHTTFAPGFPSTVSQAAGLLLFNLAVVLSMDRQWKTAEEYLNLALPGLSIAVDALDGRKHGNSSNPTCLPLQAINLQLYLFLALNNYDEAIKLIRGTFGHLAFAGRLNSPSIAPHLAEVQGSEKERAWTINELRQLLKGASVGQSPSTSSNQRQTNLWAPPTQQQQQQLPFQGPSTPQPTLGFPPAAQPNAANRWINPSHPASRPTYATGLITPANENDWPPL